MKKVLASMLVAFVLLQIHLQLLPTPIQHYKMVFIKVTDQ